MRLLSERIKNVMDGMKGHEDKRIALAEIAGVSTMLVDKWLRDTNASIDHRCSKQISENLGYRTDWIMRGIGPAREKKSVTPSAVGKISEQQKNRKQPISNIVTKSEDLFLTYVTGEEMRLLTFCRTYPETKQKFLEMAEDVTNNQP